MRVALGWLLGIAWGQVAFYIEPIRFLTLEGEPYLELFLGVDATSVRYKEAPGGGYKGEVEFSLILRNAVEEPVYADKFRFMLPALPDTAAPERRQIYADIRRLRLPPGTYLLELEGQDPNQLPKPQKVKALTQFEVLAGGKGFGYSDLLYAKAIYPSGGSGYERHGLRLEPWISNGLLLDPDTSSSTGKCIR